MQAIRRYLVRINGGRRPKTGKGNPPQRFGRQSVIRIAHAGINQEARHVTAQGRNQDAVRPTHGFRQRPGKPKHGGTRQTAHQSRQSHCSPRPAHFAHAHVGKIFHHAAARANHKNQKEKQQGVRVVQQQQQALRYTAIVVIVVVVFRQLVVVFAVLVVWSIFCCSRCFRMLLLLTIIESLEFLNANPGWYR